MTAFTFLSALPSILVAYFMVCKLNSRRRKIYSVEGWSFLMIMGGAIFSFFSVYAHNQPPSMGKFILDLGICMYFGERTYRTSLWHGRHKENKWSELNG